MKALNSFLFFFWKQHKLEDFSKWYARETSPLFIGLENRLKTISLHLIWPAKAPQQLSKKSVKAEKETDFQNCPKRKEPLGLLQAWRSTGPVDRQPSYKEPLALGRPVRSTVPKEETQFPSSGRPVRSTETSREQFALRRSTGPVDRQTCTNSACPDTSPVDRAGRPELPETENWAGFELEKFWEIF